MKEEMRQAPRIVIVACEESGDFLGGDLIKELKRHFPAASFAGVGGLAMHKQGLKSWYKMEELTAHGIVEILPRIPKLLWLRSELARQVADSRADIFIGIDAPNFNVKLEEKIRQQGIKTVHYISPTVWAWRPNRIADLAAAIDLLLCVYPFEPEIYEEFCRRHQIKVNLAYVGHPLADEIPLINDKQQARRRLQLPSKQSKYVAVLPGSRATEIKRLSGVFIGACAECLKMDKGLHFIFAAINEKVALELSRLLSKQNFPAANYSIVIRQGRDAIAAADAALLASGTASLETMLIKRPMVVAYKLPALTYWIVRRMLVAKYISLPNFLFDKEVVPELVQSRATPAKLAEALMRQLLTDFTATEKQFTAMHKKMKKNASRSSAKLIAQILQQA